MCVYVSVRVVVCVCAGGDIRVQKRGQGAGYGMRQVAFALSLGVDGQSSRLHPLTKRLGDDSTARVEGRRMLHRNLDDHLIGEEFPHIISHEYGHAVSGADLLLHHLPNREGAVGRWGGGAVGRWPGVGGWWLVVDREMGSQGVWG